MGFLLVPIGNGSEHMKQVELRSDDGTPKSITLGRNVVTGLDDLDGNVHKQAPYVSRSHVEVCIDGERVTMNPIAKQEKIVHLNGIACERGVHPLQIGDVISFVGRLNYFNYELRQDVAPPPKRQRTIAPTDDVIEILDGPPTTITGSRTISSDVISLVDSPPTEAVAAPQVNPVITNLLRQYECPICYESIACAESLNPCGCVYCFSCIMDWSKKNMTCPTCNTNFDLKTSVPSKLVDNAVRDILKNEAETLKAWEERVQKGLKERTAFREARQPLVARPAPANQPQPFHPPAPVRQTFVAVSRAVPPAAQSHPFAAAAHVLPAPVRGLPQTGGGFGAVRAAYPNAAPATDVIDLSGPPTQTNNNNGRAANNSGGVVDLTVSMYAL